MKRLILLILVFMLGACEKPNPTPVEYKFFVAGHSYGTPGVNAEGLYAPFKRQFKWLQENKMSFGVLTGDIVITSTEKDWDEVDSDLEQLKIPVHFAPGNHDLTDRALYAKRYGESYYKFEFGNDLYLVLDPTLNNWNIQGPQLEFLKHNLGQLKAKRVFLFAHQMIWWEPRTPWDQVRPNSLAGRSKKVNFWTEIEPLLKATDAEVYLFCGDVGAFPNGFELAYQKHEKINFISSGMGGGKRDNLIVVSVTPENVKLEVLELNGTEARIRILEESTPVTPKPSPAP